MRKVSMLCSSERLVSSRTAGDAASIPLRSHGRLLDCVIHQANCFLVAQLVPQAITSQNHKLILRCDMVLNHIWLSCHSGLQICISQRPAVNHFVPRLDTNLPNITVKCNEAEAFEKYLSNQQCGLQYPGEAYLIIDQASVCCSPA